MDVASNISAHRGRLHRRGILLEAVSVAWCVIEAGVAVAAGLIAGSPSLLAFGADSGIEVVSAAALLWRLLRAGADASAESRGRAERGALYVVSATFFVLAAYITFEGLGSLREGQAPERSPVGLALAIVALIVMPTLAFLKRRTGRELGSKALQADAVESWVCSYLSLALLVGVG